MYPFRLLQHFLHQAQALTQMWMVLPKTLKYYSSAWLAFQAKGTGPYSIRSRELRSQWTMKWVTWNIQNNVWKCFYHGFVYLADKMTGLSWLKCFPKRQYLSSMTIISKFGLFPHVDRFPNYNKNIELLGQFYFSSDQITAVLKFTWAEVIERYSINVSNTLLTIFCLFCI